MKRIAAVAVFSAVSLWAQNPNCSPGHIQTVSFTGTTGVAIAASGNQLTRVCKIYLTSSASTNLALISAGSATPVSGTIQGATAWQAERVEGAMRTKAGEALTITSSTSATISGSIVYYREQP